MEHGKYSNGIRKVALTDNLGRTEIIRVGAGGTLREAIGDIWATIAAARKVADSPTVDTYWQGVSDLTARCGDEVEQYHR